MAHCSYTLVTVFIVDLLATCGDITLTWSSPILTKLYSNDTTINPLYYPITEDEESWISSLLNIGAMIGPFPYGYIATKFGRKIALLSTAAPFVVSFITLSLATNVYLYYFARLFAGVAVGGGYTLLPMYVAEIAEDSNRGMLSVTLNIFWTFGNFIPYAVGPYLSVFWFNLLLACIPTLFFVLFFLFALESPYFLISKNKISDARNCLQKLRSKTEKQVQDELTFIRSELEKNQEGTTIYQFFTTKAYVKGLSISLFLILCQQLSGINAVLFYTEEIFEAAGVTDISADISSIIIGLVVFLSSFGTPFVVDKLGRKLLLLVSSIGVSLSLAAFGVYFFLKNTEGYDVSRISYLPIISLVAFIVTYNVGLGPVPWTISSELFPTNVKTYAASIVAWTCWTSSFLVTKFFNNLNEQIGEGETFWLFSGFSFAASIYTLFFVPETKGKSFQQIQMVLDQ